MVAWFDCVAWIMVFLLWHSWFDRSIMSVVLLLTADKSKPLFVSKKAVFKDSSKAAFRHISLWHFVVFRNHPICFPIVYHWSHVGWTGDERKMSHPIPSFLISASNQTRKCGKRISDAFDLETKLSLCLVTVNNHVWGYKWSQIVLNRMIDIWRTKPLKSCTSTFATFWPQAENKHGISKKLFLCLVLCCLFLSLLFMLF